MAKKGTRWLGALLGVVLGLSWGCGGDSTSDTKTEVVADLGPETPDAQEETGQDVENPDPCNASSEYLVGMGVSDITGPAADAGLMGYAQGSQHAAGLFMRQWAKALVVVSPCNGKRVLIVVLDTQAIFQDIHTELVAALKTKYGDLYTLDNVILNATHTHSVPGGAGRHSLFNFSPIGGFYKEVLDGILYGTLEAIDQAHESLVPGALELAVGELTNASVNRSPDSFAANPEWITSALPDKIDPTNTLLKVVSAEGKEIGMLDLFAVHTTSVAARNLLVGPDNKGLAAHWFQEEMARRNDGEEGFVAAFGNTNAADMSPNVDGFSFEHKDGVKDYEDLWKSAQKQYQSALDLYDQGGEPLVGGIDYRFRYVKFDEYEIDPAYTDGKPRRNCPPMSGLAMMAGGKIDWPVVEEMRNKTCEKVNNVGCTACQGEKPEAVALFDSVPPKVPMTLPFHVVKIGQFAFAAIPFEVTVGAGLVLRKAVMNELAALGVTHTVCLAYTNAYADYLVTRDEYALQDYEAGFTIFGPWPHAATVQITTELAKALAVGQTVDHGPMPEDNTAVTPVEPYWNKLDEVPEGVQFGEVAVDAPAQVVAGDTVNVTFWAAHLANDFMLGKSFFLVERLDGDEWVVVANDNSPSTKLFWERVKCTPAKSCSQSRVEWKVPETAIPGTYRISYKGVWKAADGILTPFEGMSSQFAVQSK